MKLKIPMKSNARLSACLNICKRMDVVVRNKVDPPPVCDRKS